jgi:hypothetical protein
MRRYPSPSRFAGPTVQRRAGVAGAVRRQAGDFQRPLIVEASGDRSASNQHADDSLLVRNGKAELAADRGRVVAVVLPDEGARDAKRDGDELHKRHP